MYANASKISPQTRSERLEREKLAGVASNTKADLILSNLPATLLVEISFHFWIEERKKNVIIALLRYLKWLVTDGSINLFLERENEC